MTDTTVAEVTTPAQTGRNRKPLTPEQRDAKNKRDRARRAATKAAPTSQKATTMKTKTKTTKAKKAIQRKPVFGSDTIMMDIVRFLRRPQGATHAEICKKFGFEDSDLGRADERGRFWHIGHDFGFRINKAKLPKDQQKVRGGRVVFRLASAPKGVKIA